MKLTWFEAQNGLLADVNNHSITITKIELVVAVKRLTSVYPGERTKVYSIDMRHSPVIAVYEFLCVFNLEEYFADIIQQHFTLRRTK